MEFVDDPKVLIVEDLAGTREILKGMLVDIGFKNVLEASNGAEALELLKSERASLIISDYAMDEMDGLQFLNLVRMIPYNGDVPFIMLSAESDLPVINKALELGAAAYVLKPVGFKSFRDKIMEVLRRRMESSYGSR